MGPVMVVGVDERVELMLQLDDRRGWWLGAQPAFHGELEAFDFAAGGGVVGSGVLLADSKFDEFFLEAVARGSAAVGEAGGEHQTVVGQGRQRDPVSCDCSAEGGDHGRAGDGLVGGDR